ncbi:hypothetical protein G6F50_018028 [Rhizopus delemar]|uniref:Uncharacterized protein n=1 Tax=Rhizopus delemar TaxID=936053 RepID=A0A9P6XNE2_9FUNG|nr:hypothetical protein G6F50_018028 [Rhizopus delemar]
MLQRALGRGVGWISWRLLGSRRRAAEVNLQLCFPEKDEAWRQRLHRPHPPAGTDRGPGTPAPDAGRRTRRAAGLRPLHDPGDVRPPAV